MEEDKKIDAIETQKHTITKHAVSRLARVAGVKSLNGFVYEEVRNITIEFLKDILSIAVGLTERAGRKMLSKEDVLEGLRLENYPDKSNCITLSNCREIKYYTNNSNSCVYIPKLVIERLVKSIGALHKNDLKYEADAIGVAHVALESFIGKLLQDSQRVAIHAKRESVQPKDIELVRNLRRSCT